MEDDLRGILALSELRDNETTPHLRRSKNVEMNWAYDIINLVNNNSGDTSQAAWVLSETIPSSDWFTHIHRVRVGNIWQLGPDYFSLLHCYGMKW